MTFLSTLLETPDYLYHLIFKEDATFTELLYVALGFAFLWGIIFVSARIILTHLTYGKPWLYAACERHSIVEDVRRVRYWAFWTKK
jgi:hypothetical protein